MQFQLLFALEVRRLLQKLVAYLFYQIVKDRLCLVEILIVLERPLHQFALKFWLIYLELLGLLEVLDQVDYGNGQVVAHSLQWRPLVQLCDE